MRKFVVLSALGAVLAIAAPAEADTVGKCDWGATVAEQAEVCPDARVVSVQGCARFGRASTSVGSCYNDDRFEREEEDEETPEVEPVG